MKYRLLRTTLEGLLALGALVAIGLLVLLEIALKLAVPAPFYLGGAGFCILVSIARVWRRGRSMKVLALGATFLLTLALLYWTPWSTRKPFLRALDHVEAGMTPERVSAIMRGYEVSKAGLDFWKFRHGTEARFNSDWGLVYFKDGVVDRTEFLPD
jgi:hypothetical protein